MSHFRISFFAALFLFCAPVYSGDKPLLTGNKTLSSEELSSLVQSVIQTLTINGQSSGTTYRKRTKSTITGFATIRNYLDLSDHAQASLCQNEIDALQNQIQKLKEDKAIYEKLEQKSQTK